MSRSISHLAPVGALRLMLGLMRRFAPSVRALRIVLFASAFIVLAVQAYLGGIVVTGLTLLIIAPWLWFFCFRKQTTNWVTIALCFSTAFAFGEAEYGIGDSERLNALFALVSNHSLLAYVILRAGLVEELAKFASMLFVLKYLSYSTATIKKPVDGVVFASAAALGFACFEGFFKLANVGEPTFFYEGYSVLAMTIFSAAYNILASALVVVPLHVLTASTWGAAFGISRFMPNRIHRCVLILLGLAAAMVLHGFWDTLAFYILEDYSLTAIMPFLYAGLWIMHQAASSIRLIEE